MIQKQTLLKENQKLLQRLADYEDRLKILEHNMKVVRTAIDQIQTRWKEKQTQLVL